MGQEAMKRMFRVRPHAILFPPETAHVEEGEGGGGETDTQSRNVGKGERGLMQSGSQFEWTW